MIPKTPKPQNPKTPKKWLKFQIKTFIYFYFASLMIVNSFILTRYWAFSYCGNIAP